MTLDGRVQVNLALCQAGRRRPENGELCEATEGHPRGERRGEGLVLPTLRRGVSADVSGDARSIQLIGVQFPC